MAVTGAVGPEGAAVDPTLMSETMAAVPTSAAATKRKAEAPMSHVDLRLTADPFGAPGTLR